MRWQSSASQSSHLFSSSWLEITRAIGLRRSENFGDSSSQPGDATSQVSKETMTKVYVRRSRGKRNVKQRHGLVVVSGVTKLAWLDRFELMDDKQATAGGDKAYQGRATRLIRTLGKERKAVFSWERTCVRIVRHQQKENGMERLRLATRSTI